MADLTRNTGRFFAALCLAFTPMALLAQSAELFLQSMDAENGVFAQGDPITIQSTTLNIGDATSDVYTINFYASTDLAYSEDDALVASQNRPALASATVDQTPVNGAIPINLVPGDYFVVGLIDYEDEFPENNFNFDASTITVVESAGGGEPLGAGHGGNWYKIERNGEGAQLELSDDGNGGLILVATIYSYGPNGGQIFLIAVGSVVDGVAMVDVYITEGGTWGEDFDPNDVQETQWGTGVFSTDDCDMVHMLLIPNAQYVAQGYTNLEYDMTRLVSPVLPCPLE